MLCNWLGLSLSPRALTSANSSSALEFPYPARIGHRWRWREEIPSLFFGDGIATNISEIGVDNEYWVRVLNLGW